MKYEFEIRKASMADADTLVEIFIASFEPYTASIPHDIENQISLGRIRETISSPSNFSWIAVANNEPSGFIVGWKPPYEVYHLSMLFVRKAYQARGIGSLLLSKFEEEGRELGARIYTVNIQRWAPWSLAFYRKHGYKEYLPGHEKIDKEFLVYIGWRKSISKLNDHYKILFWKPTFTR